jgi:5'-3' exonuclease
LVRQTFPSQMSTGLKLYEGASIRYHSGTIQCCKSDVANLMFNVAWCHAPTAYQGNHDAPLRQLNKFILLFKSKKLNLLYVLDGKQNIYKAPEELLSQQKRGSAHNRIAAALDSGEHPELKDYQTCVSNTPRFIALTAKLLAHHGVPYIVAPDEADGMVAAYALDNVAISCDSDLLAHGVGSVVRVLSG